MNEQRNLFETTSARPRLGSAQEFVLDKLRERPRLDAEAGALLHERRGRHPADEFCDWCAPDGRQVLSSLRRHGLVRRSRATGFWRLADVPASGASGPGDLPEGF